MGCDCLFSQMITHQFKCCCAKRNMRINDRNEVTQASSTSIKQSFRPLGSYVLSRINSYGNKMASSDLKGQAVDLTTCKNYGKEEVIGCKTMEHNGKMLLLKIACLAPCTHSQGARYFARLLKTKQQGLQYLSYLQCINRIATFS